MSKNETTEMLERLAKVEEAISNLKENQNEFKQAFKQFWEALKSHEDRDQERFETLISHLEDHYVRKTDFKTVRNLAFGFAWTILAFVVKSLLALI